MLLPCTKSALLDKEQLYKFSFIMISVLLISTVLISVVVKEQASGADTPYLLFSLNSYFVELRTGRGSLILGCLLYHV